MSEPTREERGTVDRKTLLDTKLPIGEVADTLC